MEVNDRVEMKKDLCDIADMLLLNGMLTKCPGLVHGKMGIAVFFFHYARYTGNALFTDYALDLIQGLQEQIHNNSPADYERGIAGIGVGIDYLIQNELLDAEDDLFEDLDQRMYRAVRYDPWSDFSLYDGLAGYGRYWIVRLCRNPECTQAKECLICIMELIEKNQADISVEEQMDLYCFLHDLHKIKGANVQTAPLERFRNQSEALLLNRIISDDFSVANMIRMYQGCYYFNNPSQYKMGRAIERIPKQGLWKSPAGMGLLTGYAGEGLLRLAALDPVHASWIRLL